MSEVDQTGGDLKDLSIHNSNAEASGRYHRVPGTAMNETTVQRKDSTGDIPLKIEGQYVRDTYTIFQRLAMLETQVGRLSNIEEEFQNMYVRNIYNNRRIEELFERQKGVQANSETQNQIRKVVDTTIHAPVTIGIVLAAAVLTVGLAVSGSFMWPITAVVCIFAYLNWRKMSNQYNLDLINVI